VLRILSVPKRDEIIGGWRKLHNSYSSLNIIRTIKSRRMKWTEHVERIGRRGMHAGFWWESQEEKAH
jgi:hypothetical protein